MADIAKMIEEIKGMTVLELNDLVKAVETEFGVSAAAMAVAGPAAGGAAAPAGEDGVRRYLEGSWRQQDGSYQAR